jgi:adenylate cyclase
MHEPPLILAVDDLPDNLEILQVRLEAQGYQVVTAADGEEALARIRETRPDLVLLDIMMPKLDGIAVVKAIRADPELRGLPIILVTAKADPRDVVEGLDAGGDDYLTKPFEHAALVARVRSMLRQRVLHDQLEERTRQLGEWARTLEERVAAQVAEIERMARLRRFLSPEVADVVLSAGGEKLLASHRREVTVAFCDMRGFTAFAETAAPEDVMAILADYHRCLGGLIRHYGGTLERFAGDGLLVLFNDPVEIPDHAARAVRMAVDMRRAMQGLLEQWRRLGYELGFGVGLAQGFVTLGAVGFDGRQDYAAIGPTTNLASRLCDEAKADQILITQRIFSALENEVEADYIGPLSIRGFQRAIPVYEVVSWRGEHSRSGALISS